jgi:ribosomal protein S18 acetylase RimI-like enzyme
MSTVTTVGLDLITLGPEQYRVGAWRGHPDIGYVVPLSPTERLSRVGLQRSLDRLAARGYRQVLTAALTGPEQAFFARAGFELYERLHLLHHDLRRLPDAPAPARLRRARRWERDTVLALDSRAFTPFWRLDRSSLDEAIGATPATRFRLALDGGPVGYAVSGHAGDQGYLQRLAVDPDAAGAGIGSQLVVDCLHWMRRAGVASCSVNTQEANGRALALYERLGFVRVEPGLAVFRAEL